jgi:hypothetical protein
MSPLTVPGGHQRRQQVAQTMHSRDYDHDQPQRQPRLGGEMLWRISTAAHSDKRPMRLPTDNFKRLLEEAYPNHAYPVRHMLKDYDMMRTFMTSRSLTWGAELDEGPDGSNTTSFPEESTIMIIYRGRPPPQSGRHHVCSISPRAPTRCGWGHGGSGV